MEQQIYKINDIKNTKEIVEAVNNGATQFEIDFDQASELLSKFGISTDDPEVMELLMQGTLQDWVDAVRNDSLTNKDNQKGLELYIKVFFHQMEQLKENDIEYYRMIVRGMFGKDLTDEEADNYEFFS